MVRGLDDDVFDTIDRGAGRTTADVFSLLGEKNYIVLAGIAKKVFLINSTGNPFSTAASSLPTTHQLCDLIDKYPRIRYSAEFAVSAVRTKKMVAPSIIGMCHYIFSGADNEICSRFFELLESGVGLQNGSPILLLRERLIDSFSSKEILKDSYKCALIFKAFKLFRDGASIKTLRVRTEGDSVEKDIYVI